MAMVLPAPTVEPVGSLYALTRSSWPQPPGSAVAIGLPWESAITLAWQLATPACLVSGHDRWAWPVAALALGAPPELALAEVAMAVGTRRAANKKVQMG